MLFAQNVIEGNQDLNTIQKEYDQNFEDEGDYFQVEVVESNEDFPHYTLCIWQDEQLLVEYSLYTGEDYRIKKKYKTRDRDRNDFIDFCCFGYDDHGSFIICSNLAR